MARIYPKNLPASELSHAEQFNVFRDHLDSGYHVYHASQLRAILPPEQHDDLPVWLIVHPLQGILALDGTPLAAQILAAYLSTHEATRYVRCPIYFAQLPASLHIDYVQRTIEGLFATHRKIDHALPYQRGVQALKLALAPNYYVQSILAPNFEDAEQRIKELTDEQVTTFEQLVTVDGNPRQLIRGVAGSGKTLIAAAVADRLARTGKQVLYTCYNRNLAGWLNDSGLGNLLTVRHFHALCGELSHYMPYTNAMKSAGISSEDYHNSLLPNALFHAAQADQTMRYDAIIVDEGQDFRQTFWQPLIALLRDPDASNLYVFCDDSQRIYTRDEIPIETEPLYLSRNLRNVKPIGEAVRQYHRGLSQYEAAGPDSTHAIEYVDPAHHLNNLDLALENTLTRLTGQGIPLDRIVLLTPFNDKSRWKDGMLIGKYRLQWGISSKRKNSLCVESVFAFKGLERPVVILSEFNRAYHAMRHSFDELCYVGYSRAKHYLILLQAPPKE